jgi:excisionase family DNA binding protein
MMQKQSTIKTPVGFTDDVLLFDNNLGGSSPTLLTISEVADFLKISSVGVRRLQQHRNIPFIKVGGSVRFLKADILSYLRNQRVDSIE